MEFNKKELRILKSALSNYIEFIQDTIEDNMKCYDGNFESAKDNILKYENYLTNVEKVFNKIKKVEDKK